MASPDFNYNNTVCPCGNTLGLIISGRVCCTCLTIEHLELKDEFIKIDKTKLYGVIIGLPDGMWCDFDPETLERISKNYPIDSHDMSVSNTVYVSYMTYTSLRYIRSRLDKLERLFEESGVYYESYKVTHE